MASNETRVETITAEINRRLTEPDPVKIPEPGSVTVTDTTRMASLNPALMLGHAMAVGSDAFIRGMESDGQRELLQSSQLPRDYGYSEITDADFERQGFVFLPDDGADRLFRSVTLPKGWKRRGSDHAMWSYIDDDKGRERVSIFYKAAFYDRSAHCGLSRLLTYTAYGDDCYKGGHPSGADATHRRAIVTCGGKPIFATEWLETEGRPSYEMGDIVQQQAKAWLAERYPDWASVHAYWDDEFEFITLDEVAR